MGREGPPWGLDLNIGINRKKTMIIFLTCISMYMTLNFLSFPFSLTSLSMPTDKQSNDLSTHYSFYIIEFIIVFSIIKFK